MSAEVLAVPITLLLIAGFAGLVWYGQKNPDAWLFRAMDAVLGVVGGFFDWLKRTAAYAYIGALSLTAVALLWVIVVTILQGLGVGG